MRITFVLPGPGSHPVGGFRVIYEYANRLTSRGHDVSIVHLALRRLDASLPQKALRIARFLERSISGTYRPSRWFDLDSRIKIIWAATPNQRWIPDGDVIVATSWETAEHVAQYQRRAGRKFYLIQDIEDWGAPRARVIDTWRLPLSKIAISKWLQEEIISTGQTAALIPNGISASEFAVETPPSERNSAAIAMLWHRIPHKDSALGLKAVVGAKEVRADLEFNVFGVGSRPAELPGWANYFREPSREELKALYNSSSIFIAPSKQEGWGLPPCEAMLCGCAVALTDNRGHLEYAIHEENALVSCVGDAIGLTANIVRLINDQDLRRRLARAGVTKMASYDWEHSTSLLHALLETAVAPTK